MSRRAMYVWKLSAVAALLAVSPTVFAVEIDLSKVRVQISGETQDALDFAGSELAKHLELACGAKSDGTGVAFVIGARPDGEPEAAPFESHAKVCGDKVWFWGDDQPDEKGPCGRRPGTLFAVYQFLDDALGFRWTYPGDENTVVVPRKTLVLEDGWSCRYFPPLRQTEMYLNKNWAGRKFDRRQINPLQPTELRTSREQLKNDMELYRVWLLRQRHFTREEFKPNHNFTDWQARYLKDHPDYFGMDPVYGIKELGYRGLRTGVKASRVKLCLSNPAVMDQIMANWREDGRPEFLNICQNDGTPGFCHCENCLKLDVRAEGEDFYANLTDRHLWFANRMAERLMRERPDGKIVAFIYSWYRKPARRERIEYPKNMWFSVVPTFYDDIHDFWDQWKRLGLETALLRPNFLCYSGAFQRGHEKFVYDSFHYALTSVDLLGAFFDGGVPRRQMDLEYYVTTRMLAFPEKSFETICAEFFSQYGAAADIVAEYYSRIRERGAALLVRHQRDEAVARKRQVLDDSLLGVYAVQGHSEAALLQDLQCLLDGRERVGAKLNAIESARFDRLVIRARHMLLSFRFFDAAKKDPRDNAFLEAGKSLDAFRKQYRDEIGLDFDGLYSPKGGETHLWEQMNNMKISKENDK